MRNSHRNLPSVSGTSRAPQYFVPLERVGEALKADPDDNFAYVGAFTTCTAAVVSAGCQAGEVDPFLATRLICWFLAARRIQVRALPVEATVLNRAALSNLTASPLELKKRIEPGAQIVHWGPGPVGRFGRIGDSYNGYLVALIDDRFVADAAIMSASDSQHDLSIDPLLTEANCGFLQGAEYLRVNLRAGAMIVYKAERGDDSYKAMDGWTSDISHGIASVEQLLEKWGIEIRLKSKLVVVR